MENKIISETCSNCKFSYIAINFSNEPIGIHCNNINYNDSETYTREMFMEDWEKYKPARCRYYEPKEEEIVNEDKNESTNN